MRQLRPTRKPFNSPVFRRVYIVFFPIFRISITSIGVKIPGNSFSESFPVKYTINDLPIANYLIVALVWFFCPRKMYIIPMKSRRTGRCRALASPTGFSVCRGQRRKHYLKNKANHPKIGFGGEGGYAICCIRCWPLSGPFWRSLWNTCSTGSVLPREKRSKQGQFQSEQRPAGHVY